MADSHSELLPCAFPTQVHLHKDACLQSQVNSLRKLLGKQGLKLLSERSDSNGHFSNKISYNEHKLYRKEVRKTSLDFFL